MSSSPHQSGLAPELIASLRQQAELVANQAYAPFSNFRVGAAILLNDGSIFTGCNVENVSYRLTTCAEQAAITSAVSAKGPGIRIRAVVIVNLNNAPCSPCGACRQTISEFAMPNDQPPTQIYFPAENNSEITLTIDDLLPYAFRLKHS